MNFSVSCAMPMERSVNYSNTNFKACPQKLAAAAKKSSNSEGISFFRGWLLPSFLFCASYLLMAGEFISYSYNNKSLGQSVYNEVKQKIEAKKIEQAFNDGDLATQFEHILKQMKTL